MGNELLQKTLDCYLYKDFIQLMEAKCPEYQRKTTYRARLKFKKAVETHIGTGGVTIDDVTPSDIEPLAVACGFVKAILS